MHYTYAMNEQPIPTPPKPSRKSLLIAVVSLGSVAIVLVAFGTTWFILMANKPQQKTDTRTSDQNNTSTAPHSANFEQAYTRVNTKYNVPAFGATEKSTLLAAYDELSEGFALTSKALDDDTTTLHALGIASLYSKDRSNKDRYRTELYLLLNTSLTSLPSGISDSLFEGTNSAQTVSILKKYQDEPLSKQVEQSSTLQAVLSNTVTQLKLGSKADLAPYTIIAFNFENTDPQFTQLTKEHTLYGARPKMWTEELDGRIYIMMFKSYAKDVINGVPGSLPHEFIHGQSAFVRGEAGRMIEERRAEQFSGDHSAYYDAKQLVIYINVFAGIDIYSLLAQNPTDSAKLYATLYEKLGVIGTNALAFSWPNAYGGTDSKALSMIYALNGQDTALKQALIIGQKDPTALESRVKQRYEKLLSVLGSKDKVVADLNNNLDQAYRMPSAAKHMIDYIKSH